MAPELAEQGFAHPECYASHLGGCSNKVTGEHYISDGVLRLFGSTSISTRDYPWNTDGQLKTIGISSFKTKILCGAHNSSLSPADEAAKELASVLTWAGLQVRTQIEFEQQDDVIVIQGRELERWVLKTLVAHQLTEALRRDGTPSSTPDRRQLVDLLFYQWPPWPSGWGSTYRIRSAERYLLTPSGTRGEASSP